MAIKFDTLEELKAFCVNFQLTGKSDDAVEAPKKRGRKPGSKNKAILLVTTDDTIQSPKKRGRKPKLKATVETLTPHAPKKRGRKPGTSLLAKVSSSAKKRGRKPGSVNKVKAIGTAKRGRKPAAAKES